MLLIIYVLHATLQSMECYFLFSQIYLDLTDENFPNDIPVYTTDLQLSYNYFTRIESEALYGLSSVTYVSIQYNDITSFPNFTYMAASVEILYLRGNRIAYINADLLNMLTVIEVIGLEENSLSSIPDVPGPSNTLHILLLNNNQFHTFPVLNELGRSFTEFILDGNLFSEVPAKALLLGQHNGGGKLQLDVGVNGNLMSLPPVITADPAIIEVNLDGVLLNCDENVAWMVSLKDMATFVSFVCDRPAHLNGKLLSELTIEDLVTETAIREKLAEKTFTDIYSNTMPLVRTSVKSLVECAVLCAGRAGCLYFNYRAEEGLRQCHYADPVNGMFYTDYAVDAPGWMYYAVE